MLILMKICFDSLTDTAEFANRVDSDKVAHNELLSQEAFLFIKINNYGTQNSQNSRVKKIWNKNIKTYTN